MNSGSPVILFEIQNRDSIIDFITSPRVVWIYELTRGEFWYSMSNITMVSVSILSEYLLVFV